MSVAVPILSEIKERGHWEVVIRPTVHDPERLPFEDLEAVLTRASVRLRGWDVPHVNWRHPIARAQTHIEQSTMFQHHAEFWRFYQSGQFIHLRGFGEDWRHQSGLYPPDRPDWRPGMRLGVTDTLWAFTEYFELASKLAVTPAGHDEMWVSITLHGLRNRELFVDDQNRAPFFEPYVASVEDFAVEQLLDRRTLVGESWPLAREAARQLFLRFGWNAGEGLLKDAQDGLRRP